MKKWILLAVFIVCVATLTTIAHNDAENELITLRFEWNEAEGRLGNAITHFVRGEGARNRIHDKWESSNQSIRETAISQLIDTLFAGFDPIGALKDSLQNASLAVPEIAENISLEKGLDTAISIVDTHQDNVCSKEYDRDRAYKVFKEKWIEVKGSLSEFPDLQNTVPTDIQTFKFPCYGHCSREFYTVYAAKHDHKITCDNPLHQDDPNGYHYYDCPTKTNDDECPLVQWHHRPCKGGCETLFPVDGRGFVQDGVHYTLCGEPIGKFSKCFAWGYWKPPCNREKSGCRNAHNHISDDSDEEANTGGTPETQMHACNDHPTSDSGDHGAAVCGTSGHYVCDGKDHTLQASCLEKNEQRASCSVTNFFACQGHTCEYPSFSPSASLNASSYSAGSSLTATVSTSGVPIYGAFLYVRAPGDTSTYGTKLDWVSGGTSTTSLDLSYTFPNNAASGSYKITVRVYPWNGNRWGVHKYISNYVNVQ